MSMKMFIPSRKERIEIANFLKEHPSLEKNQKVHAAIFIATTFGALLLGLKFSKDGDSIIKATMAGAAVGAIAIYLHRQHLIKKDEEI